MSLFLDLATRTYVLGIRLATPWSPKARSWVQGRKGLWDRMLAQGQDLQGCIWVHSASAGEFEQVLPVLERLKEAMPSRPVLLTFFSPSGHAARRDHPLATHVEYLPSDTAANARRMVELAGPALVLWAKYDFWQHHLQAIARAGVPLYLISASFRPGQPFFRWYGGGWRRMLHCFTRLFVQDERSRDLLAGIGTHQVTVSGDTRYDRVKAIAAAREQLPIARAFRKASELPVLVAGSTWPGDEDLLAEALRKADRPVRTIVAPHEIGEHALARIERTFPAPVVRWSAVEALLEAHGPATDGHDVPEADPLEARTLLVDRVGLLSRLYQYGDMAYVGGGFGTGIHSVLEPAAWGLPVAFGPRHHRFPEAGLLIGRGAAREVKDLATMQEVLSTWCREAAVRREAGRQALRIVEERSGATERILQQLAV